MFESFGRGFKMIWASVKMGWQDKRLLLPSILTVFTNLLFGVITAIAGLKLIPHGGGSLAQSPIGQTTMHGLIKHPAGMHNLAPVTSLNGPLDPSGWGAMMGNINSDGVIFMACLGFVWWLTNRIFEGVTTALVYSHLSEGKGSGKFSEACTAVLSSLPAIIVLGIVTFIAKRLAGFMRNKGGVGAMSFGFSFLANLVEIFWTLAGHLILPAIVIEGTSFWGGLKRADKIAQGNLLTIGVGEVGVDAICRIVTMLVYAGGVAGFGYATYAQLGFTNPLVILGALIWAATVVTVTALSIYIRAAFYTCLYAWAIEAEAVQATERVRVKPPGPLAAALA